MCPKMYDILNAMKKSEDDDRQISRNVQFGYRPDGMAIDTSKDKT